MSIKYDSIKVLMSIEKEIEVCMLKYILLVLFTLFFLFTYIFLNNIHYLHDQYHNKILFLQKTL